MARCQKCLRGLPHVYEHGSSRGYLYHGCRCDECKGWCRARGARYHEQNPGKRSCVRCARDELHSYEHGTATGYTYHGCRCESCVEHRNRYKRTHPGDPELKRLAMRTWCDRNAASAAANRRRSAGKRERARSAAKRAGDPWSPAEDAIALRTDIGIFEAAYMLSRSYDAVRGRRQHLGRKQAA